MRVKYGLQIFSLQKVQKTLEYKIV